MHKKWIILLTTTLVAFAAKSSSAAVTLKQNWQAGQQLVYDTNIDGELNLQIPSTVTSMIAGMPIEIALRGVGKTTLNTLKINDFGDGTVQASINPLSLEGETFGQKVIVKVNNGTGVMTLNGAPQKGSFIDWNLFTNPPVALTFSSQMKVTNVTSIKQATSTGTESSDPAVPTNIMAIVQNLILQSLPAVLPTKSLNVGDQWTSDVQIKTSPAPNAAVFKLGSFQFELKDPKTMEGRSLQHITVRGNIDLPSAQSKKLISAFSPVDTNNSADSSSKKSKMLGGMLANHLFSLGQSVEGDLYFDTQAGHFVQADLNLNSEMQTIPDTTEPSQPDGFLNFKGTVRFKLAQVLATKTTP
ncbi:MAG: hypothetical protein ABI210_05125 [Abditibacteriaceae bacterium]